MRQGFSGGEIPEDDLENIPLYQEANKDKKIEKQNKSDCCLSFHKFHWILYTKLNDSIPLPPATFLYTRLYAGRPKATMLQLQAFGIIFHSFHPFWQNETTAPSLQDSYEESRKFRNEIQFQRFMSPLTETL